MPEFLEVREASGDKANWMFVAFNDQGDPANFIKEKGWDPAVFSLSPDIKNLHSGGIPATYFFDSSGKLVETVKGPLEKAELEAKLATLQ